MKIELISALLIVLGTCYSSTLAADDRREPATSKSGADDVSTTPEAEKKSTGDHAAGDLYLLRYKFRKGDVLRYESSSASEATVTREGGRQAEQSRTLQVRRFEVIDVDDTGQAKMQMRFETVEMSLTADGFQPIVYRSSMAPSEVPRTFALVADRLRKAAPQFVVAPTGAPLKQDGELVGSNDGNDSNESEADESETRLLLPLPESAVAIGESWKYYNTVTLRVTQEMNRNVRLLTSCRLQSVDGDTAKISFRTSVVSSVKSPRVKALLLKALPAGHVQVDLKQGRIIERVIRNDESVFGVYGPKTLMTMSSHTVEKLMSPEPFVSIR